MFDLNQFRITRPGEDVWEADLPAILNYFQDSYFSDVKPIESAEFASSLEGPSRVIPDADRIEVDERLRNFPKLCCLLVLHELIHNKLYKTHGFPQSDTGDEFLAEVRRLWEQRAYEGLM